MVTEGDLVIRGGVGITLDADGDASRFRYLECLQNVLMVVIIGGVAADGLVVLVHGDAPF